MGFVAYTVQTKTPSGGSGVSVSLRRMKSSPVAKMALYLSAAVAATFEWSDGLRLEVAVGTDDHHGLIRLRTRTGGSAVIQNRKGPRGSSFVGVDLGFVPGFVARTERKQSCKFEIVDGGWVQIRLPIWADETAPRRRLVPARQEPDHRPKLGTRLTDLAPRLQGDPPLTRSALVAGAGDRARQQAELRAAEEDGRRESEAISREERRAGVPSSLGDVRLNNSERRLVGVLADATPHSRGDILERMGGSLALNSISAMVSTIRRKLRTAGVGIETIPGGFQMKPDMAARARAMLGEVQAA